MAVCEGRLSVVLSSVFPMGHTGFADRDEAYALVESALAAVRNIRDGAFWKLLPDEQLEFGRRLEMLVPDRVRRAGPPHRRNRTPRHRRRPVLLLHPSPAAAGVHHLRRRRRRPGQSRRPDPAPRADDRRHRRAAAAGIGAGRGRRLHRPRTREDHRRDHGQSPRQRCGRRTGTCARPPSWTPRSTATRTSWATRRSGSWTGSTPTGTSTTPPRRRRWNSTSAPAPPAPA